MLYLVIGMVKNINPSGVIYRYQQWLLGFDISTGRKTFDHGKHIKQFQYLKKTGTQPVALFTSLSD